jgi:hypothetical protein
MSMKNISGFTGSVVIRLKNSEDREVSSYTFEKADLVGKSVEGTLTNVPEGAYVMYVDGYNTSGGIFSEIAYDVEVIGDRTVESNI